MKKEDFKANAAILLTAALMYVALLSPFSVIRASGAAAAPVYRSADEGRTGLVIRLSWDAGALNDIRQKLAGAGVRTTFAVTPAHAEKDPSEVAGLYYEGHEIVLLIDDESTDIGSAVDLLERITGERPRAAVADDLIARKIAAEARKHGLRIAVPTVDLDAARGSAEEITARFCSISPEGAFCACDPTAQFADALPDLLEKIKNMGLDIAPLHKMLYN